MLGLKKWQVQLYLCAVQQIAGKREIWDMVNHTIPLKRHRKLSVERKKNKGIRVYPWDKIRLILRLDRR